MYVYVQFSGKNHNFLQLFRPKEILRNMANAYKVIHLNFKLTAPLGSGSCIWIYTTKKGKNFLKSLPEDI